MLRSHSLSLPPRVHSQCRSPRWPRSRFDLVFCVSSSPPQAQVRVCGRDTGIRHTATLILGSWAETRLSGPVPLADRRTCARQGVRLDGPTNLMVSAGGISFRGIRIGTAQGEDQAFPGNSRAFTSRLQRRTSSLQLAIYILGTCRHNPDLESHASRSTVPLGSSPS